MVQEPQEKFVAEFTKEVSGLRAGKDHLRLRRATVCQVGWTVSQTLKEGGILECHRGLEPGKSALLDLGMGTASIQGDSVLKCLCYSLHQLHQYLLSACCMREGMQCFLDKVVRVNFCTE
jgi:hypothetical protein